MKPLIDKETGLAMVLATHPLKPNLSKNARGRVPHLANERPPRTRIPYSADFVTDEGWKPQLTVCGMKVVMVFEQGDDYIKAVASRDVCRACRAQYAAQEAFVVARAKALVDGLAKKNTILEAFTEPVPPFADCRVCKSRNGLHAPGCPSNLLGAVPPSSPLSYRQQRLARFREYVSEHTSLTLGEVDAIVKAADEFL